MDYQQKDDIDCAWLANETLYIFKGDFMSYIARYYRYDKQHILKLVCTLLNYRVLGTSTAYVFLSNEHSLYAPIYIGWTSCLISFAWDQSTCQERVGSEKIHNEKFLPTVGLEPTTLRFQV